MSVRKITPVMTVYRAAAESSPRRSNSQIFSDARATYFCSWYLSLRFLTCKSNMLVITIRQTWIPIMAIQNKMLVHCPTVSIVTTPESSLTLFVTSLRMYIRSGSTTCQAIRKMRSSTISLAVTFPPVKCLAEAATFVN